MTEEQRKEILNREVPVKTGDALRLAVDQAMSLYQLVRTIDCLGEFEYDTRKLYHQICDRTDSLRSPSVRTTKE